LSGSPYIIKDRLTIAEEASLTIESGVVVKMYPSAVIEVNGSINTQGTEQDNVVFTSIYDPEFGGEGITDSSCYWETIDIVPEIAFTASYTKFIYGKNIFNVKGILNIDFSIISNGVTGINVESTGLVNGTNSVIKYCSNAIYNNGIVSLMNCHISDCEADSGLTSGVRPFGIEKQDLVVGKSYVLKYGAGGQYCGNFHALALGGTGAANFEDKIVNGYSETLNIGDYVFTEPGNMKNPTIRGVNTLISKCTDNCTFENHKPDCPRIITVIMAESLQVNGRKEAKIVGFPRFYIENIQYRQGHTEITAIYIGTPKTWAPGMVVTDSGAFYGTYNTFERCSKGIELYGTAALTGCRFMDCEYGLFFDSIQPSYFSSNSFINNTLYGVFNNRSSETNLDFSLSYWGSPDGPSIFDDSSQTWTGNGDRVSNGVNYSDWLMEEPEM
jgi:hypothetical protein